MSSGAMFDAEMSAVYSKMSAVHVHPNGPWKVMTQAVEKRIGGKEAKVLDLASGMGEPGGSIAKALPKSTVWCTDQSEDMVANARKRLSGVTNARFQVADMENLSVFPDSSFDIVTCCYGFMFPKDKQKAVGEAFRVLQPGGVLIATYWEQLPLIEMGKDICNHVTGSTFKVEELPINPLSLRTAGEFDAMLAKAGFRDLETTKQTYPFEFGKEKELHPKIGTLVIRNLLLEHASDAMQKANEAFFKFGQERGMFFPDGSFTVESNKFVMVVASK